MVRERRICGRGTGGLVLRCVRSYRRGRRRALMSSACLALNGCLQCLVLHMRIVCKGMPVVETRGCGTVGREHWGLREARGQLRCGCRLLNPDGRAREVKGSVHERVCSGRQVVVDDDGRRKGLLLRFEIVVQQFLVEERLRGELLREDVEGDKLRRRWRR